MSLSCGAKGFNFQRQQILALHLHYTPLLSTKPTNGWRLDDIVASYDRLDDTRLSNHKFSLKNVNHMKMPDKNAIKAAVVGAWISAIAVGLVVAQAYNSSDSSLRGRQDRKRKRGNLNKLMTAIEEIAAALIELTHDKQLVVSDLYEEIKKTEGFEETFLASAFDFLVENEMLAKGFLVKSPKL